MSAGIQEKETVQKGTRAKKRRGTWLLILLIIFLILFLLSCVVLGARLYERATRDRYAVDMSVGTGGELELFRIEYSNEAGEITVKGANGQKVIAPGTTIDYDINLRNRDDVNIDFVLKPQVTYLTGDAVPLQVKLSDHYGNYILGSDSEWVSVDALNGVVQKGAIHEGEVFTYHLSWQWVFEADEAGDAYDTYLGNAEGAGVEISVVTESSANPAEEKHVFNMAHLLGEGFGCCWCCYLVWILLLVCVLLLLWIWRLRRKLSKREETMEEYEEVLTAHGLMAGGRLLDQSYEK